MPTELRKKKDKNFEAESSCFFSSCTTATEFFFFFFGFGSQHSRVNQ